MDAELERFKTDLNLSQYAAGLHAGHETL